MGLWKWITESLIGGSEQDVSSGRRANAASLSEGGEAVAVLDDPAGGDSSNGGDQISPWWSPDEAAFKELQLIERPEMSNEDLALESVLVSHFDGHDLSMPTLPRVAELVLSRLGDRNLDLADVARDISEDQVLAATVLRIVNSPLYRGQDKITSLQLAISRLGIKAIRAVMMQQAIRSATFQRKGMDNDLANMIWRRSLSSACIMRGLAGFTTVDAEDAFLMGLLHDIGNVIVFRLVFSEEQFTHRRISLEMFEYLCQECHQEFGELVADEWQLPADLKCLISNHHSVPEGDDPLRVPRLMLQLTDMINSMLGYSVSASYDLLGSEAAIELGLPNRSDLFGFLNQLPADIEDSVFNV